MKVLVLDGHNRAALAVTRSLGRAGHRVCVGDFRRTSLAQASRYCSEAFVYPDPVSDSDAFIDNLAAATRDRDIEAILPVSDITTFLVTRHRDRFAPGCLVPFANADVVERVADKVDLVTTAQCMGVPVPRFVVVRKPQQVPAFDFGYPLVIKPWRSRIRTADGWISTAVSYASSEEELRSDLGRRAAHEFPVMLQERIVGQGTGVFALYQHGRAIALFSHRRIRERPPWGGVSVLAESVELCPRATAYATRLLDELGWHGVAMVEFKRDNRNDEPTLMEINGRFWGSLQLAIDAGVDFPAWLLEHSGTPALGSYRVAVRTRWFWGDVDSLLLTLFARSRWPGGSPVSRAGAVRDFCTLAGKNLFYDNPKPDDPRPWLLESSRWLFGGSPSYANGRSVFAPASSSPEPAQLDVTQAATLGHMKVSEESWNALLPESETNTVFQTHQWTRSWLTAFPDEGFPHLMTVRDGGRLVGLVPLNEHKGRHGSVLRFVGDVRADYCDVVATGDKREMLRRVLEVLGPGQWRFLDLRNIPEASSTPALLADVARDLGYFPLVETDYVCPALEIAGREEDARAIANKASVRRRTNYFDRAGNLTFRDLSGHEDVEPHLDEFFRQHVARWNTTRTPSLFHDLRKRTFYRVLTHALSGTGWLLFSTVELNGRPIAMHYGFDYGGVLFWYKPTFDVTYAAHSPGIVLVRHLIQHALDLGRRELDFTRGDESFKHRFTNTVRSTKRVRIFRNRRQLLAARARRRLSATLGPRPV